MTQPPSHTPGATGSGFGALHTAGVGVLRHGLVFVLLTIGSYKFFQFEAEGIQPLIANSPLMAWLYTVMSIRTVARAMGVVEIVLALLVGVHPWAPRASAYASLAVAGMFAVTLSFLFTTPGAISPMHPYHQFLLKDVVLLGVALLTAAEAMRHDTSATDTTFGGSRHADDTQIADSSDH